MANNNREVDGHDGIPNPCVRNCCLNENDICLGCYRSITEIISWHTASDEQKKEILKRSDQRRKHRA